MSEWYFLLAPLAVLAFLHLFGIVACAAIADLGDYSFQAHYDDAVKGEPSLVAYWRLQEQPSAVGSLPCIGCAQDVQGAHNGDYNALAQTPGEPTFQSPGTAASVTDELKLGLAGLIKDGTVNSSIEVQGGFVEVPFRIDLSPDSFTFEMWVTPEFGSDPPGTPGNYYCLIECGGPEGGGQKTFGFGLYAGPQTQGTGNPTDNTPPYFWQVWMGDGSSSFTMQAISSDTVHFGTRTYLALAYDLATGNLNLYTYYPDDATADNSKQSTVNALSQSGVFFTKNSGASLLIGAGRNIVPAAGIASTNLYPFRGKIEMVALYNIGFSLTKAAGHATSTS